MIQFIRQNTAFVLAFIMLQVIITIAYSNHFDNPFHFDDSHTIETNAAIRDLGNWKRYFTDPATSSSLPANQAWRPGVTTINAIDTYLSGGTPDSSVFHRSIFINYLMIGWLVFAILYQLLKWCFPTVKNMLWAALLGTAFYMLHTANAETINYIIARTDTHSTFFILLSIWFYFLGRQFRNWYLFLIPLAIGFLIKEPAVTVGPILMVLEWLFHKELRTKDKAKWYVASAFGTAVFLFMIARANTAETWTSGGGTWYHYLITQSFVIVHYFNTWLLPVNLSADTDWMLITNFFDDRVLVGAAFILGMFYIVWRLREHQQLRGVSFGIAWFFLALAPTSSVYPFAEVLNDHRIFYPFIGLTIAGCVLAVFLLQQVQEARKKVVTGATIASLLVVIMGHSYGTYLRNEVWGSGETLWNDVTEKSPGNGRGWMNYGNALMTKGDIKGAISCYEKSLEIYPNYMYAHINMGIAKAFINEDVEAEKYFKRSTELDASNPEGYYHYGNFLLRKGRIEEGRAWLMRGLEISPEHAQIKAALAPFETGQIKSPIDIVLDKIKQAPTPENYVELSLAYYQSGQYIKSAEAALEATKLKADYGIAWNNVCAAYNKAGMFEEAMAAGETAVKLQPNDQLANNNYKEAVRLNKYFTEKQIELEKTPNYNGYIQLSLDWYNQGQYENSIAAAEKATQLDPNQFAGWNNICASANKIGLWDKAIAAGEKAVAIDPNSQLAKNNLAEAQRGKNKE
jgi:protein O-mannosyl-transferase